MARDRAAGRDGAARKKTRPRPASAPRQRCEGSDDPPSARRRPATPRTKVILEITVEIGNGRTDLIRVCKGDHARELAVEFVERNRLAAKVVDPLADHIESHLVQLRRDQTVAERSRRGRSASRERHRSRSVPRSRSRSRSRSRGQASDPPSHHTFKPAICPTSTAIAATMSDREGSAFDRLHQESKARRIEAHRRNEDCNAMLEQRRTRAKLGMSEISRALAETRGELNGAANYGDKLFREGVTHARQKEELLAEIREQEELRKDDGELTFKPKISAAARKQRSKVLEDYAGEGRAMRQEAYTQIKDEREIAGCSFKPHIPATSRELARRSKRAEQLRRRQEEHEEDNEAVTVHDELAADVHERRRRLEAYETSAFNPHGANFHPDVGLTKLRPRADRDDDAFVDRLVNSNRERERQLALVRARQIMNTSAGPAFQPRIRSNTDAGGVATEGRRRPEKMNVHEHLYASREQFVDIKNTLAEREQQKRWTDANRCHTQKRSQQHVDARRRRRAREIFRRLAGDQTDTSSARRQTPRGSPKNNLSEEAQFIDMRQLCLEGLSDVLVKELVPELLRSHQATHGDGTLDFDSFFAIVEDIAADETTELRAVLHHRPLPEAEAEERRRQMEGATVTGKPRINPVSREIAEQLANPGEDIHTRNLTKQERQRQLQQARRVALEEAELQECTFQPRTNQSALAAWRAYRRKEFSAPVVDEPATRHSSQECVQDHAGADSLGNDAVHDLHDEAEDTAGFDLAQSRDILKRLADKVRRQEQGRSWVDSETEDEGEYE